MSSGLGLISAPILARALGPDGRGQTAAALAVLGLLPIVVGFGVPLVVRRASVDADAIGPTLRSVRLLATFAVIPSILLGWACAIIFLRELSGPALVAFLVAVGMTPLAVLWICDANVLVAQRRFAAFALVNVAPSVIYVGAIAVGFMLGVVSVTFVVIANLASTVFTLVLTTSLVRVPLRGERSSAGPILRSGLSFSGSQIAEAASYRLDQAIALPLIGADQAGYYSVAATIALIPYSVGQAVGTAAFRHLALEKRDHVAALSIRIGILTTFGASVVLAALTPVAVPVIFGEAFAGSIVPTYFSLLGSTAVGASYVASTALTARGKGWIMTTAQIAGLALGVIGLLILGPLIGAVGAAIASSFGYLVCAATCIAGLKLPARSLVPRFSDVSASARMLGRGQL